MPASEACHGTWQADCRSARLLSSPQSPSLPSHLYALRTNDCAHCRAKTTPGSGLVANPSGDVLTDSSPERTQAPMSLRRASPPKLEMPGRRPCGSTPIRKVASFRHAGALRQVPQDRGRHNGQASCRSSAGGLRRDLDARIRPCEAAAANVLWPRAPESLADEHSTRLGVAFPSHHLLWRRPPAGSQRPFIRKSIPDNYFCAYGKLKAIT